MIAEKIDALFKAQKDVGIYSFLRSLEMIFSRSSWSSGQQNLQSKCGFMSDEIGKSKSVFVLKVVEEAAFWGHQVSKNTGPSAAVVLKILTYGKTPHLAYMSRTQLF